MDAFLALLVAVGVLGLVAALALLGRPSLRGTGVLADSAIRSHEREELGLGGAGRPVRAVRPRYR